MRIKNICVYIIIVNLAFVFLNPFFVFSASDSFNVNLRVDSEESISTTVPSAAGAIVPLPDEIPLVIKNITVKDITLNSAAVLWEIDEQAICSVFWGKTLDYEAGTLNEGVFLREHQVSLIGLFEATRYHFKISCCDTNFNEAVSEDKQFTTLTAPDTEPPSNVKNLEAIASDQKILLKWENPPEIDFKEVRIFRSDNFYPTSPQEGVLIYQGNGTSVEDIGLINGITYYYTAFSYDYDGNMSSGAVIQGTPYTGEVPPVKPPVEPPIEPPPPEVDKITLDDFSFWQGEQKIWQKDKGIFLKTAEPLNVSIDYEKVPEVLKTIMVTIKKENKYFSFLLRVNKDKTRYTATLLPPEPGIYPFSIYVMDYKNQALKKIDGWLEVAGTAQKSPQGIEKSIWLRFQEWLTQIKDYKNWFWLIISLLITYLTYKIYKAYKSKKENRANSAFVSYKIYKNEKNK